ncbi:MAG TPA: redoxin family protein, partial [Gemmataceae bacterium]|nr:redoxin family protein [Gemmataceae bacterium]
MPSLRQALFLSLAVGTFLVGPAAAAEVKVGDKIDNLAFTDTRYLPRSLDDFKGRKAFVVIFTTTGCPVVQRYLPTLQKLETEYRGKGVQFVAVNVGPDDSIRDLAAQQVEHGMEFPFVKDFDHSCARKLGATRTPTAVVLDGERTLRYRGRIDDRYRLGGARGQATRNDLKEALDAVLAGKAVTVKETTVDGCAITPPPEPRPAGRVTFADDVAPVLRKHCQDCHRPGTAAPFSLITYEQVAAKANTVAEVVAEGRMPPWYAASGHGEFVNRRGLTAAERDTLRAWVRAGKPKGDEAKLPKPPPDEGEKAKWLIGEPDLVLQAPEHSLPAEGDIAYKYEVLKHLFTEDTWVQGVQILPSNPRVVHHCNMIYALVKEGFKGFKQSNFITGQVPGGSPMKLDSG